MYYTHKFLSVEAKAEGVIDNTIEMVFSYFWSINQSLNPKFYGMNQQEIAETKTIIMNWVVANQNANLTELADFASRLIEDYKEMKDDK